MKTVRYFILVVLLLIPSALAQAEFDVYGFDMTEFRNIETVDEACGAPAASSFFCGRQGESLTRIPTKGADFFFNPAGELVAVFSKQQKGQRLRAYPIDGGQNLIPFQAPAPGAAILIGGEYVVPEAVEGSWSRLTNTEFEGSFRYLVGSYQVDKRVVVSNVRLSLEIGVEVSLAAQAAVETGARDPIFIQLAFPGIGRTDEPVIKIGQGENFSLNPLSQPVVNPSYASVQNNNRNTATAIVMRPTGATGGLSAQSYPGDLIAFQKELTTGSTVSLSADVYTGPNELVRYDQEGYLELAGLFRPNILGRLSLAILWVLRAIHDGIGNWGLSIIVLTLVFRAVIWPLISTQTRSMYGMQELQPKIQTLQKKYKDDRQKLTEETMKLYKEAGVNPAGGCLPILAQMPLFIILWRVFVNFEFNEGFLWIPDLGQADPLFILPILYVGVMLGQSFFTARGNPSSLRQQIIINLVFAFIILNFPAGVILYFVVSMLVQIFQYWLISRNKPVPATAK